MLANPVFIIGTERSGSNLLRLLLDTHSKISIPHPPHLMRDLAPIMSLYGDLSIDSRFRLLVSDAARIVNLHFAPWPFKIQEDLLFKKVEKRSLYGVYAGIYQLYVEHTQKARWGCKSTFMYQQIDTVLENHEHPFFIHLVRDPRDVAASAEQSIFSHYHPYKQALLWDTQQREIEKHSEKLSSEGLLIRVKYEDLTTDPELVLNIIMGFLGEKLEKSQLEYFKGKEAHRLSQMSESWKNCSAPVSKKSVGRFRSQLTKKEVYWVELHAHELMEKYGYELAFESDFKDPSFAERIAIELQDRVKMVKAEIRSFIKDENFSLRWKRRAYLQYLQRARGLLHD